MGRNRRRRSATGGSDADESDEEWLPSSLSQPQDAERRVVVPHTTWLSNSESEESEDDETDADEDVTVPLAQRDVVLEDDSETEDEAEEVNNSVALVESEDDALEDVDDDNDEATDDEMPETEGGRELVVDNETAEDDDDEKYNEDAEEMLEEEEEMPSRSLSRTRELDLMRSTRRMFRSLQRVHLPRPEFLAIRAGQRPTGPPFDLPLSVGDQWKRFVSRTRSTIEIFVFDGRIVCACVCGIAASSDGQFISAM
ncbi:hypothetical protein PINS_up001715 [Pythium insidiosum]|nr:hypothetical protein PINS_up001715 [Pythium insidiosum]